MPRPRKNTDLKNSRTLTETSHQKQKKINHQKAIRMRSDGQKAVDQFYFQLILLVWAIHYMPT